MLLLGGGEVATTLSMLPLACCPPPYWGISIQGRTKEWQLATTAAAKPVDGILMPPPWHHNLSLFFNPNSFLKCIIISFHNVLITPNLRTNC
jgi:hypothetical protein